MGQWLGQNIQVHRACCCRTRPVTALPCAHPFPYKDFQRCSCYLHSVSDSPQAVKEPWEVRPELRATSWKESRSCALQVSVLAHRGCFSPGPQLPPQAPAPAAHKQISLSLPCGWLGRVSHAYQERPSWNQEPRFNSPIAGSCRFYKQLVS